MGEEMKGSRIPRAIGIVFLGAVVLTVARNVAAASGIQLGAIPTLIIVAPFLYWAFRAPPKPVSDEQKLEKAAATLVCLRLPVRKHGVAWRSYEQTHLGEQWGHGRN